jgi:micrococcal nuclease
MVVLSVILCTGQLLADQWVQVANVIDGDTVRLHDGRMVRYLGIDAPEIDHGQSKGEPYGFTALEANRLWIGPARKIRLVTENYGLDHYGRILAQAFNADGRSINKGLIAQGLATVLCTAQTKDIEKDLIAAQRAAMQGKVGIWENFNDIDGPFLGNWGSLRFHDPACPFAQHIHTNHRIALTTLWQAFWLGFAPCSFCRPATITNSSNKLRKKNGDAELASPLKSSSHEIMG